MVPPLQKLASEKFVPKTWRADLCIAVISCAMMLLALSSCTPRDEPTTSEAPTSPPVEVDAESATDEAVPDEQPPAEPVKSARDDSNPATPIEELAPDEPASPSRDLASELRTAVGRPVDCIQDYRPTTPTTVRVNISATVRPSGLVIEPSATGRGLSYNDRKCIEERVGSVTLAPLATQTSQTVSVFVDLELGVDSPTVEEDDVGGPAPKLEDVVEPLPKKKTIPPSGVPIQKAPSDKIEGSEGVPIEGPKGVPVEGPKPTPIEGYEVEEDAERWTDE